MRLGRLCSGPAGCLQALGWPVPPQSRGPLCEAWGTHGQGPLLFTLLRPPSWRGDAPGCFAQGRAASSFLRLESPAPLCFPKVVPFLPLRSPPLQPNAVATFLVVPLPLLTNMREARSFRGPVTCQNGAWGQWGCRERHSWLGLSGLRPAAKHLLPPPTVWGAPSSCAAKTRPHPKSLCHPHALSLRPQCQLPPP